MSLILDALRRKRAGREAGGGYEDTARRDSVLSTLGYPRQRRDRPAFATPLMFGGVAVAAGLVGLSLLAFLPASSPLATPPAHTAAAQPGAAPLGSSAPLGVVDQTRAARPEASRGAAVEPAARTAPAAVASSRPPSTPIPAARRAEASAQEAPALPVAPPARPQQDHFGLAIYYQRVGDFDNALAQYRTLLEQNDGSAEVHNNVGLLYQGRDQLNDAIKEFRRAIVINPKYTKAHNNLGVALMRSGQPETAEAEFRVALAADPRNVESMVNLALVHRSAGRVAEARDLLLRAVAIDPRNAGSHYNLAVAADQAADTAVAIEHYRAFLRLGAVGQTDLPARVRARLTALGG